MQAYSKSALARMVFNYLRDENYLSAAREFCKTCSYLEEEWQALEIGITLDPLVLSLSDVLTEYVGVKFFVNAALSQRGCQNNDSLLDKVRRLVGQQQQEPNNRITKRQRSPHTDQPQQKRFRGENSSIILVPTMGMDETETTDEGSPEESQEHPALDVSTVKDACMTIPDLPQMLSDTINGVKNENMNVEQVVEETLDQEEEEEPSTSTSTAIRELRRRTDRPDYKEINYGAKIPPKVVRNPRPQKRKKGTKINVISDEIIQQATNPPAPLPVAQLVQHSEQIDINSCAIVFVDSHEAPQVVQVQAPPEPVLNDMIIVEETTPQVHQPIEPKTVSSTSSRKSSHIRNLSFTTPAKELETIDELHPTEVAAMNEVQEERPKQVKPVNEGLNEWTDYRKRFGGGFEEYLREENSKEAQQQKAAKKKVRRKKSETLTTSKAAEVKEEFQAPIEKVDEEEAQNEVKVEQIEKIYFKMPTPVKKTPSKIRPTQTLPSPKSSPEDVSLSNSMIQAAHNIEAEMLASTSSPSNRVPSSQIMTTIHTGVRSDEYVAALSLSSMSSLMEKTPFKTELFDLLPITPADPNFTLANQTMDTPLTKFINENQVIGIDTLMKNYDLSSINTPTGPTPKTPGTGQGSPSTESKSVGGYSSAASSYYRPDDNDKLLEKQINSEQMKATAEKLRGFSSTKKQPAVGTSKTPAKAAGRKSREALDEAERNVRIVAEIEEKKSRTLKILKLESQKQRGSKILATQKRMKYLSKIPTPRKKGRVRKSSGTAGKTALQKRKTPEAPKPEVKMSLRPKRTIPVESKISPIPSIKKVDDCKHTPASKNNVSHSTPIEAETSVSTSSESSTVSENTTVKEEENSTVQEEEEEEDDDEDDVHFTLTTSMNLFEFVHDESSPRVPSLPSSPINFKPARIKYDDFNVLLRVSDAINLYEARPGRRTRHSSGSFKETPKIMEMTKTTEFGALESLRPISPPKYRDFSLTPQMHRSPTPYMDDRLIPKINVRPKDDTPNCTKPAEKGRMPLKIDMKQNNQQAVAKIDAAKNDQKIPNDLVDKILHQVHGS